MRTFSSINFFPPNIVPLMRSCGKILESETSHILHYNVAHAPCILVIYARDTCSKYLILITFSPCNNGYANAPQCCVIRTLHVRNGM